MSQPIAIVLAALISALATIMVAYRDRVIDGFRPSRSIKGDWVGDVYLLGADLPFRQEAGYELRGPPHWQYTATLKQTGPRVTGTMSLSAHQLGEHTYKGTVKNDFFVYQMTTTDRASFRISAALLRIDDIGKTMTGYFVANPGPGDASSPVLVGYTTMRRRA